MMFKPFFYTLISKYCFVLCLLYSYTTYSQDSTYIKVHFLYGSKPIKKYKKTEPYWFGGIRGGHVGIEGPKDKLLNFMPDSSFHWFSRSNEKHSAFIISSENEFYSMFGTKQVDVKKAIVNIPITLAQKGLLDSIANAYLKQPPYDYAFIGMRCGSAVYDILARLSILPVYHTNRTTYLKIFYPKKLRKRLFRLAKEKHWKIDTQEGTYKRKWEKD